jgi:hypothetical protein
VAHTLTFSCALPMNTTPSLWPAARNRARRLPAQVLPDERDHAQVPLQLRDIQVAVDAVDALQLEHDMTGQDISGRTG